jgi:tetratricopeptide (TPR) repeat protein
MYRPFAAFASLAFCAAGPLWAALNDAQSCQAYASAGAWNAAIVACGAAIDTGAYTGPALGLLHATRADALAQRGENAAALGDYDRAVALNPKAAAPRFARAGVYLRLGDPAKAVADFRDVVRLRPRNHFAHFGLGSALALQRQWQASLAALNEAIRLKPDYGVAYRLRAEAHAALGDAKKARQDRDRAKRLGVAELRRAPTQAAAATPAEPVAAPPETRTSANAAVDQFVLEALAECAKANANKDWDQAVATCTRAIESRQLTGPRLAGAYGDRAIAHDEANRPEEARKDYARALGADPGNPVILANRGVSFAKDGEIARALADYDAAIAKRPRFGYAYAMRGLTLLAMGEDAKAKSDLQKAYDLGERHPVLLEKLSEKGWAKE